MAGGHCVVRVVGGRRRQVGGWSGGWLVLVPAGWWVVGDWHWVVSGGWRVVALSSQDYGEPTDEPVAAAVVWWGGLVCWARGGGRVAGAPRQCPGSLSGQPAHQTKTKSTRPPTRRPPPDSDQPPAHPPPPAAHYQATRHPPPTAQPPTDTIMAGCAPVRWLIIRSAALSCSAVRKLGNSRQSWPKLTPLKGQTFRSLQRKVAQCLASGGSSGLGYIWLQACRALSWPLSCSVASLNRPPPPPPPRAPALHVNRCLQTSASAGPTLARHNRNHHHWGHHQQG